MRTSGFAFIWFDSPCHVSVSKNIQFVDIILPFGWPRLVRQLQTVQHLPQNTGCPAVIAGHLWYPWQVSVGVQCSETWHKSTRFCKVCSLNSNLQEKIKKIVIEMTESVSNSYSPWRNDNILLLITRNQSLTLTSDWLNELTSTAVTSPGTGSEVSDSVNLTQSQTWADFQSLDLSECLQLAD